MSIEHRLRVLEATDTAVRAYARAEFQALTRKAVYRLQRISSSGIFGCDYAYKSLWDEYCHEVQNGPHEILGYAWDQILDPIIEGIIECVPRHSAALLSQYSALVLDEAEDSNLAGAVWPDGMRLVLRRRLSEHAGLRNLERLQS